MPFFEIMEEYLYEIKNIIDEFTQMIKKRLVYVERISVINLIIALVYQRDTIDSLI